MKVLIPGFFTTIEGVHIQALAAVKEAVPADAHIELLVMPKAGYDPDSTRQLLETLPHVSHGHIVDRKFVLSDTFLESKAITCVVEFTPAVFEFQTSWPRTSAFQTPKCILQVGLEHPDFVVATRLFKIRQSPRHFLTTPVNDNVLAAAIDAARRSPSAGNLQPYSIVLVRNKRLMQQLSDVSHHQEIVAQCAGIFVFVEEKERSAAKYRERGATFYAIVDTTIACSHMQLALQAVGVQSRWIGAFRNDDVDKLLKLGGKRVIGLLLYGYGDPRERQSQRREVSEYLTTID